MERVKQKKAQEKKNEKPKCELKSQICSGSLMAKYTGKKKGDPTFYACRACIIFMKLGKHVKQVR